MPIIVSMLDKSTVVTSGSTPALSATGPDTLTVKSDGFLITTAGATGAAARLSSGPWTVTIDGNLTALNTTSGVGLFLDTASTTFTSKVTIGTEGSVYGGQTGIRAAHATSITNRGSIFASSGSAIDEQGSGNFSILNYGAIDGNANGLLISGDGTHTINNYKTIFGATNAINATGANGVEKVLNMGTIDGLVKLGGGDDTFTTIGLGKVIIGDVSTPGLIDMGAGNDKFLGGSASDLLVDGAGNDTYTFGAGNDTFRAASVGVATELDKVDGGLGIDTYDYSAGSAPLVINLDLTFHGSNDLPDFYGFKISGTTADTLTNGLDSVKGFENVKGGSAGDVIFGSGLANTLEGAGGNDDLWGFAGNDTLNGGAGDDFIVGGLGKDVMSGGAGNDTFIFRSTKESGTAAITRDLIKDFSGAGIAGGDVIDLLDIDAKFGGLDDAFTLLAANSRFNGVAGELRYEWTGLDTIIEGDINGDRKADFTIAVEGTWTFIAGDFQL